MMAQMGNGQGGNVFPMGRSGDYIFGDGALDDLLTQCNYLYNFILKKVMEQHAQNHRPPPANEDTIAQLPSIHVKIANLGEHVDCAICQDEYKEDELVKQLPCHHLFHPACIENWLKVNGTCPVCRHSLVTPDSDHQEHREQE